MKNQIFGFILHIIFISILMQCYSQNDVREDLNERTIYETAYFHCFLKSLSPHWYIMFLANPEILLPKHMQTYRRCQLQKTFKRISWSHDLLFLVCQTKRDGLKLILPYRLVLLIQNGYNSPRITAFCSFQHFSSFLFFFLIIEASQKLQS